MTPGMCTQREERVKTQQAGGHVQAQERGLKEPNSADTLTLDR